MIFVRNMQYAFLHNVILYLGSSRSLTLAIDKMYGPI